jgi:predicted O-linked N-acetylglucosamine transferase (SPINDLY family)
MTKSMNQNNQHLWQQALIAHQNNQLTVAIALYHQVIDQNPQFADAYANLAMALAANAQHQEADQAFCRSLALQPNHANNHSNYGFFLHCLEQHQKAEQHLRRAVQLNPQLGIAWLNLGNVLRSLDRWEEAVSCYQVAWPLDFTRLDILSDWVFGLKKICRWSAQEAVTLTLLQASADELECGKTSPINPFVACMLPLSLAEFQQICVSHAQAISNLVQQQGLSGRFDHSQRQSHNKIKVGYVCAAFSRHPTGHLAEGMFERHDRSRFEIYGYAVTPDDGSCYRQHIQNTIEHFRDVHHLSSLAIAETIFQDGIDILVDLDGYTSNHRQQVFALKPAPIQVTWLAFPGTTGASYMDYLIADAVIVPPESDRFYSEKIIRLPHTYQVNNHRQLPPIDQLDRPTARQAQGLPTTAIVFCSFNNNTKIDFPTYQAWLNILKAVPESVLWILVDTSEGIKNLRRTAQKAGVDPARIIPAPRVDEPREHIQRIQLADLYLDCFICNAHTTATDVLWAGVPVLTCAGETFASRVGASLVTAAGLPQLICTSATEFVAKAIHLAHNPHELQALQQHLQTRKWELPLFDTDSFVRSLESALIDIHPQSHTNSNNVCNKYPTRLTAHQQ